MSIQPALFDYAALDADTRSTVETCRDEIKRREKRATEDIVEIGRNLKTVQEAMPGRFEAWLRAEFDWSRSTAYNLIQVATAFGDRVQNLDIAPSALYRLAADTTPIEIREQFISQAEAGDPVRLRDVRQVLRPSGSAIDPFTSPNLAERDALQAIQAAEYQKARLESRPPIIGLGDHIRETVASIRKESAEPTVGDIPLGKMPVMRERTPEERAFDRMANMQQITEFAPEAVADAAVDHYGTVAWMFLQRVPALETWSKAFVAHLRARIESPLRAVK